MAINKFQRSRLTFDLSAKSLVLESHQYIKTVFSQATGPIELKFYVKTPWAKLAKIYTTYFGHMTKMTGMHIDGKNSLKIFSRTGRPVTFGLVM